MRASLGRALIWTRLVALAAVGALCASLAGPLPASAAVPAVRQRTAANVTADALPTAQIDGVVWQQAMAGNIVFAGGSFQNARPAGAAPGTQQVPRTHLLAYDVRTGVLTAFAPVLNEQVKAVALSPDLSTLYVGGNFTTVNGVRRNRFAAFDVATGALKPIAPDVNYTVNAITATATRVYLGGAFSRVNDLTRSRLAAIDTSGGLTAWAPQADATVHALVRTPDGTSVIAGGAFGMLNGATALGMGSLDATTGASKAWKVNTVVKNYGSQSAILSLSADASTVYGTGYAYGGGNFEGVFAANPQDGSVKWLQDCHGDTYGVAPIGGVVYSVGHAHYCSNIGGFPDTNPRVAYYRALAVTAAPAGTVATNGQPGQHHGNFAGQPAPALFNWFPDLRIGSYTGTSQAAWSAVGNSSYLALAGEFLAVNGTPQQGLVRLALPAAGAPGKQGPRVTAEELAPTAALTDNTVALSWRSGWDRDDQALSYEVLRNGVVVHARSGISQFWNRPTLRVNDAGLRPGTYGYQVRLRDPDGNIVTSTTATVQVPGSELRPAKKPYRVISSRFRR